MLFFVFNLLTYGINTVFLALEIEILSSLLDILVLWFKNSLPKKTLMNYQICKHVISSCAAEIFILTIQILKFSF